MMIPPLLTLNEVFSGVSDTFLGYWSTDSSLVMPWADTLLATQAPTLAQLDIMLWSDYGARYVSPLTRYYIKVGGGSLPIPIMQAKALSLTVYHKLFHSLKQEALALGGEYNPLNNYDMTENETNGRMKSGTDTTTSTPAEYTTTTDNKISGLDSPNDLPGAESDHTTSTLEQGTNPGSSSTTYGSREDGGHTLTRAGNIGVMSSQSLAREETELRYFSYWERMLELIAREITIPF